MYLISASTPPQMYELYASSKDDRRTWMSRIQQTALRSVVQNLAEPGRTLELSQSNFSEPQARSVLLPWCLEEDPFLLVMLQKFSVAPPEDKVSLGRQMSPAVLHSLMFFLQLPVQRRLPSHRD